MKVRKQMPSNRRFLDVQFNSVSGSLKSVFRSVGRSVLQQPSPRRNGRYLASLAASLAVALVATQAVAQSSEPPPPLATSTTTTTTEQATTTTQASASSSATSTTTSSTVPVKVGPSTTRAIGARSAVAASLSGDAYGSMAASDGAVSLWHLNEATGTVAADSIGSRTGVRQVVVFGVPGILSGDGAIQSPVNEWMVVAPGTGLPSGGTARTYEGWLRVPGGRGRDVLLLSTGGVTVGINYDGDRLEVTYPGPNGTVEVAADAAFTGRWAPNNAWHHLAVTYSSSTLRVFMDGALAGTFPGVVWNTPANAPVNIGFVGGIQVDEVAMYPTALSPAVIGTHARVGFTDTVACTASPQLFPYGQQVVSDGAVSFWRLGETTGLVAADSQGCRHGVRSQTASAVAGIAGSDSAVRTDENVWAVVAPGAGLPSSNSSRTIEGWVRTPSGFGRDIPIVSVGGLTLKTTYNGDRFEATYASGSPTVTWTSSPSFAAAQWNHFALTYDGSAIRVFTNGVLGGC